MVKGNDRKPSEAPTKENRAIFEIAADPGSSAPAQTERRIALCVTCELRESCGKPVPPGGIWHCADFR